MFDHFVLGDVDEWCNRAALHWRQKRSVDWDNSYQEVNPKVLSRYGLSEEVDLALLGCVTETCEGC
jgi:hypothetical protein